MEKFSDKTCLSRCSESSDHKPCWSRCSNHNPKPPKPVIPDPPKPVIPEPPNGCSCDHENKKKKKLYIRISITTISFVFIVSSTILIVPLILPPTAPQFIVQGATVDTFSISDSNSLTSNLRITLSSRNLNGRISIYYDKLEIRILYRGQQITPTTMLSCTYQGHKDKTYWSPNLCADAVPLAPDLAASLNQEQMVGRLLIDIEVGVQVRWIVGKFISGTHHLYVNCPAYINFSNQNGSINAGGAIELTDCHVDKHSHRHVQRRH